MSEGPALRVDGERVSPDRFYATACDPAKSVVVEACAGSGKTWMLVSRIVRLLLAGVEPHHILAITFTRAAAGEMRDRLAGWLADWSMRSSVEERIGQLLSRTGKSRQDEDARIGGILCGHVLLGHQIHSVAQRRHQTDTGDSIEASQGLAPHRTRHIAQRHPVEFRETPVGVADQPIQLTP